MIKGYTEFTGKHLAKKKENREYYDKPKSEWISYGDGYMKVDMDDYNHKTGELDEPIHGKPRSEAIIKILDSQKTRYNGIITEHGKHLFFRKPSWLEEKNKINWHCPLGVKLEYKFPASDDHIPLKVNGVERKFFKGSIDNEDVDEIPFCLYPLQTYKHKPFDLNFPSGDRTQKLGAYLFYLVNKDFTAEQAFEIVRLMNEFIFEDPIPDSLLKAQILNDSTLKKLQDAEKAIQNKEVSPESFKRFLSQMGMCIRYNELLNVVEFENVPEEREFQDIKDFQNQMPTALQYAFRTYTGLKNISKQQTVDLIALEADKNSYNPVKDYLKGVPWDEKDRFPEIFDILGVQNPFEQSLIRKWFYQSAALPFNTLEEPIQPEGVLILQGAEGIGKTRFFRLMTPNPLWFTSLDKPLSTKNKDTLIETLSGWITEIGEIDRTFKENRSDIKNFMTQEKDKIRKPYAREPVTKPRTTSFCGTTNKPEFLNDDSGFRRWWVVPIKKRIVMDNFIQPENLNQFWAQCYNAFCDNHQCFRVSQNELEELESKNKEVMEMIPAEDELRLRMNFDAPESEWIWIQAAALKNLPEYDVLQYSSILIGKALTRIAEDFPAIQRRKHEGLYKWFIPPAIQGTNRLRNKG